MSVFLAFGRRFTARIFLALAQQERPIKSAAIAQAESTNTRTVLRETNLMLASGIVAIDRELGITLDPEFFASHELARSIKTRPNLKDTKGCKLPVRVAIKSANSLIWRRSPIENSHGLRS